MSPCCDLNLENRKPVFLHDAPAQDDASQYQVWLQNDSLEDIWINIDTLTICYDNDLECSNPILSKDTLAYDDVSSDQVWLPKN